MNHELVPAFVSRVFNKSFQVFIALTCVSSSIVLAEDVALTIYSQNYAVVKNKIRMDLKKGINKVAVNDITSFLEPESVLLRDPEKKNTINILEQNYRADTLSSGVMLSLYDGKEIEFLAKDDKIVRGKIIRSGFVPRANMSGYDYDNRQYMQLQNSASTPIIEVDGKLKFSLPGEPLFPPLTDNKLLKPEIQWLVSSERDTSFDAELNYVTKGLSWSADYNLIFSETGNDLDLTGWVSMGNQSGKKYENVNVRLMAGDVVKITGREGAASAPSFRDSDAAYSRQSPPVSGKPFDEFHIYTVQNKTTLNDKETKQIEFVRANNVPSEKIYIYDGADMNSMRDSGYYSQTQTRPVTEGSYGIKCNTKVSVIREIKNTEENRLGIPLPRGKLRCYRQDDNKMIEFTGENVIDHTAKNETVKLYLGNSFDLVGERKQVDFKVSSDSKIIDETFEIKLRNRKEKDTVEIRVVEHLYRWRNWNIMDNSHVFMKTDSQTIEFRVQVPPNGEECIKYKVKYTW